MARLIPGVVRRRYIACFNDDGDSNRLYRNDDSLTYTDQTTTAGVADGDSDGYSVQFADFDNDGDLDIHLGNEYSADRLFQNTNGVFTDVGAAYGVANTNRARGTMWGDVDGDGDLDLYLSNFGAANVLYLNTNRATTTLFVRPVSTQGYTTMFGATVNLYLSDTSAFVATRMIDGGSGYASQNAYDAQFAALSTDTCYDVQV